MLSYTDLLQSYGIDGAKVLLMEQSKTLTVTKEFKTLFLHLFIKHPCDKIIVDTTMKVGAVLGDHMMTFYIVSLHMFVALKDITRQNIRFRHSSISSNCKILPTPR